MTKTQRVDWFQVIVSLSKAGYSPQSIADAVGVARTTLLGWKQGAEPRYTEGERLIVFWSHATGQSRERVPMCGIGDWWAYHGK